MKAKTQIDASRWVEATTYFDGLGRAYKTEEINTNGNIFTETKYDNMGRVSQVSNPDPTGVKGSIAAFETTTEYDFTTG